MTCQKPSLISEMSAGGMVLGGGSRWGSMIPLRANPSQNKRNATNPVDDRKYRVAGFTFYDFPILFGAFLDYPPNYLEASL